MKLFVGIDVSSQKLDVCFLDSDQNKLIQKSLENNLIGTVPLRNLCYSSTQPLTINGW
jgi:hypothetical protein